jgi:hypothetical protein
MYMVSRKIKMSTKTHEIPGSGIEATSQSAGFVSSLIERGVEVVDTEALASSLDGIMTEYGVEDSFLEQNPKAAILLAGVAAHKVAGIDATAEDTARQDVSITAILKEPLEDGDEAKDSARWAAIERFTNKELSEQLAEVFHGPIFADIREKLGVSEQDIAEGIDVRVLDIATGHEAGLPALLSLDSEGRALYEAHKSKLNTNAQAFKDQSGSFQGQDTIPPAWMRPAYNGRKSTIFMPALLAEAVILKSNPDYVESHDVATEFAEVRHEMVHCLKDIFIEDGFYAVGLLLEERRAEYYSGDKSGYFDIKKGLEFVLGTYGSSIEAIFPEDGSYSPEDTLTRLAAVVGLETMFDLATAIPESYEPAFSQEGFGLTYLESGNSINSALLRILRREKRPDGDSGNDSVRAYVDRAIQQAVDRGGDLQYMGDVFALAGPKVLAILAIKDFQSRYPDVSKYDWESVYGSENWALTI